MPLSDHVMPLKRKVINQSKAGFTRVREGFLQSLQIVLASVGAYAFCRDVLGHPEPIFAATAAVVSLGYVRGATHSRRILEVTLGVTLGILVGDGLMHLLGRGTFQAAVVLLISVSLARFLDRGMLFTIQMGLQSALVVLMEPTSVGTFARSVDGIVGGIAAFLVMFIFPRDPRVLPRSRTRKLMSTYSNALTESAQALRSYSENQCQKALEGARDLQPLVTAAQNEVVTAKGLAQLSVVGRNHKAELRDLGNSLGSIDLSIRNIRVFNRRMVSTVQNVQLGKPAIDSIVKTLQQLSSCVSDLGEAAATPDQEERFSMRRQVRDELGEIAQVLEPSLMGVRTLEGESLILLLRPMVIDLLEATGLSHEEAMEYLVPLGEGMTEHAPRTSQLSRIDGQEQLAPDDTRALNVVLRSRSHPKNAKNSEESEER
ncbi:FUSC family protein [Rothia sp. LK2588]|uniref:aromatic acid exporter family protein n=1 Tax=Rothia sp. LK2588 TaxID=3114369 RepID=UPI0034CFC7E4